MPVIPKILQTKYRTAKNHVIIQLFTGKYNTMMTFYYEDGDRFEGIQYHNLIQPPTSS